MKILLISITGALTTMAAWSLVTHNAALSTTYIAISAVLLGATFLGGVLQYNLPESQDTRDVVQGLKEKNRILQQKISILQEAAIQSEKEAITLREKRTTTLAGQNAITRAVEFF